MGNAYRWSPTTTATSTTPSIWAIPAAPAPAGARAEVLAGFFLGAYVGLSIPVVGLGIVTMYAPARDVILVFVVLAATAITSSVRPLVRRGNGEGNESSAKQPGQVSAIHEVGSR